jgi:hypothetical protein
MLLGITGRPAHPSVRRLAGVPLAKADMPDTPLLLCDGYALPVTAHSRVLPSRTAVAVLARYARENRLIRK